jgi:hypothetical protein
MYDTLAAAMQMADLLREEYPDLVVSVLPGRVSSITGVKGDDSVAIHPHKKGHPQVNVRFFEDRVEWQGYWAEIRWGYPLGYSLGGMEEYNYVLPTRWGKACDTVNLGLGDLVQEQALLLTRQWFENHPPGAVLELPPIPEGTRMATAEEIAASCE